MPLSPQPIPQVRKSRTRTARPITGISDSASTVDGRQLRKSTAASRNAGMAASVRGRNILFRPAGGSVGAKRTIFIPKVSSPDSHCHRPSYFSTMRRTLSNPYPCSSFFCAAGNPSPSSGTGARTPFSTDRTNRVRPIRSAVISICRRPSGARAHALTAFSVALAKTVQMSALSNGSSSGMSRRMLTSMPAACAFSDRTDSTALTTGFLQYRFCSQTLSSSPSVSIYSAALSGSPWRYNPLITAKWCRISCRYRRLSSSFCSASAYSARMAAICLSEHSRSLRSVSFLLRC